MNGYAELLESDFSIDDVHRLKQSIQEVKELLHHSINLAESGLIIETKSDVDLDILVREVAKTGLDKDIKYEQDILPVVQGDRTKIAQVFRNLFDNAVVHGSARKIHVTVFTNPEGHSISVSNDGEAIPNEIRSKIFERGFSSKGGRPGYGLTIVNKILEAHGWTIALKESKQTIFEISIPFDA
jgi:signal transduction histidine kinase